MEGLLSLFENTHCQHLLSAPEAKVDHILQKHPMQHHVIGTFDEWVKAESDAPLINPPNHTYSPHDPFIVTHTSGSTGLPKPITLFHGGVASADAHRVMPRLRGYSANITICEGERMFVALPPFHVSPHGEEQSIWGYCRLSHCIGRRCPGVSGHCIILRDDNSLAARRPPNQSRYD